MLDDAPGEAPPVPRLVTLRDPVPEPIEAAPVSSSASESSEAMVLNEREFVEASGPIGTVIDPLPTEADTRRVALPIPREAFRPPDHERAFMTWQSGTTVSIFDRRAVSRLPAPTSFVDAAAAASGSSVLSWRTKASRSAQRDRFERAVEYFDRGLALRLEGRYGEALDAWERALALAPANELYQSHVRRLRLQLHALRARGR
jgi:hypothetical protein